MENKRGSGIFLGVVAVATLVVAIIGATFAYFSVTASSDNDAVNFTAYEFNASLSVNPLYPTGNYKGLIPLDPDAEIGTNTGKYNLLYAINETNQKCVDDGGYQVCAVYELTFENTGFTPMVLSGTLVTKVNQPTSSGREGATAFTDLKARVAEGTLGTGGATNSLAFTTVVNEGNTTTATYTVPATEEDSVAIGDITVPAATESGGETTNGTYTCYIVVYLDGTNDGNANGVDQSAQMGATYQGQLVFASSAGNKLTGTFTINNGG